MRRVHVGLAAGLILLAGCSSSPSTTAASSPPPTTRVPSASTLPSLLPPIGSPETVPLPPKPKATHAKPPKPKPQPTHTGLSGPVLPSCAAPPTDSVEYKLAAVQLQAPPDADTVTTYCGALNRLQPKCKEIRERLGDEDVVSQQLLRNAGIVETLLSILVHVRSSIPNTAPRMPCADIFAAYVLLRKGG